MTEQDRRRCIVCHRGDLAEHEPQTCRHCSRRVAHDLEGILRLHAVLGAEMAGRAGAARSGGGRGGSDDAIPMAEILCLIGPGSDRGEGHASDPPSVEWELSRWEDDWRHVRGHGAAPFPASAAGAGAYLAENHSWAAQWHPAFDEYANDLGKLLGWLRRATRTSDDGLPMEASCFECGGNLVREYAHPRPCPHPPGSHTPRCDQGGLRDTVRCEHCGRHYTAGQYALALRQLLEHADAGALAS